jgi:hypothetical protein
MLQWLWTEMGYRLDVGSVTKDLRTYEVREKQTRTVFLSICRPHVTILSAIQLYRFHEGIINNPVYTDFVRTSQAKGCTSIGQKNWQMFVCGFLLDLLKNIQIDNIGKIQIF